MAQNSRSQGGGRGPAGKVEEHSFKRMGRDLKAESMANVILLYGREQYLVRWSLGEIKNKYINPAVEMFDFTKIDGTETTPQAIIEACETMPMMSERRMVVVEDLDENMDHVEDLAEYFNNFPEFTQLVFTTSKIDRKRKLYKSIQKNGAEYEFSPLDPASLRSFIAKRLRTANRDFALDVPAAIIDMSGYYAKESDYTLDNLVSDIEKIIAHAGDSITVEDVEETIAGTVERDVFAFADALASGRRGDALSMLTNLMDYGGNVFQLLALICSQLEIILMVKEMRGAGMNMAQMKAQLGGVHEFRIKKAMQLEARYDMKALRQMLMKAYEVDRNIKSGLTDNRSALELLAAGV